MPWSPDYLEDGSSADASSVNTPLAGAQTWLQDITADGLRRGTFNRYHAGCLLTPNGAGYTVKSTSGVCTYTRAVFGASIDYAAYGTDGGSATGGDLGAGDRSILGHPSNTSGYAGPSALITFPGSGIKVGVTNGSMCAGILLMLNAEIVNADINFGPSPIPVEAGIMCCFQYKLSGSATWYTLDRSERFMNVYDHVTGSGSMTEVMDLDIPITSFLSEAVVEADGTASTDYVQQVRAMVSSFSFFAGSEFTINRWRLTAVPLLAQDNG